MPKRLARAAAGQAAAARVQADASVKMAEEMQKQRLESLRPIIDVVLAPLVSSGLVLESLRLKKGLFSDKLRWEVSNIGVGPALEVEVSLIHPSQVFNTYKGGTLQRESQPSTISLKEAANAPYSSPPPSGSSVVATYVDVYGRQWQSKRELTFDPDNGIIHGHLVVTPL